MGDNIKKVVCIGSVSFFTGNIEIKIYSSKKDPEVFFIYGIFFSELGLCERILQDKKHALLNFKHKSKAIREVCDLKIKKFPNKQVESNLLPVIYMLKMENFLEKQKEELKLLKKKISTHKIQMNNLNNFVQKKHMEFFQRLADYGFIKTSKES